MSAGPWGEAVDMRYLTVLLLLPLAMGCEGVFGDPDALILRYSALSPVEVVGNQTWSAVSAGFDHTCALTTAGSAYCWGSNEYLQTGSTVDAACQNGSRCVRRPTAVPGGHQFVQIAAGTHMSCGLTAAGAAWCWGGGYETDGRSYLGDGTLARSATPLRVASDSVFTFISSVFEGGCALTASGQAWCWGQNTDGRLGDGSTVSRLTPVAIGGALRFSRLAYGGLHRCGVATDGALYCWGENRWGQLAIGDVPYNNFGVFVRTPTAVIGGGTFADAAAGGAHTCALRADGQVLCAGSHANGMLGDGSMLSHRGIFSAVAGGLVATQITAGYMSNCALTADGSAYCWGSNWYGGLGIGYRNDGGQATPQRVDGGPFAKISVGGGHGCAITPAQRLYCWGDDTRGAVGRE